MNVLARAWVSALVVAAFAAGCGVGPGAAPKAKPARLAGEGSIKVGGGCVVYRQAEITFAPGGDGVAVTVDNNLGFFYDARNRPLPSYATTLSRAEIEPFFGEVKGLCAGSRPEPWPSTGAATMVIELPLAEGRVAGKYAEARRGGREPDPLLEAIRRFAREYAPGG
jgi:hypothetical protein